MLPNFSNHIFHWLWKDLSDKKRKAFISSLLLKPVGLGSQILSYSILFRYLNSPEKSDTFSIFKLSYFTRDSPSGDSLWSLTIVAGTLGLLFVYPGFANHRSRSPLTEIAKQYDITCSNKHQRAFIGTNASEAGQLS